jgi:hypothetical protein
MNGSIAKSLALSMLVSVYLCGNLNVQANTETKPELSDNEENWLSITKNKYDLDNWLTWPSAGAKFDPEKWKTNPKRFLVLYDLIHTHPLIGMTKSEIVGLLGTPRWVKDELESYDIDHVKEDFLVLQLDYLDGRVRRFRVCEREQIQPWNCIFGSIFTRNLKKEDEQPRPLPKPDEYGSIDGGSSPDELIITEELTKFDEINWRTWPTMSRESMVFDLVHSVPLIGMTQKGIHELLGSPDNTLTYSKDDYDENDPPDPKHPNCDWYILERRGYCGSSGHEYIQIIYDQNKVVGFRQAMVKKSSNVYDRYCFGSWQKSNLASK